MTTTHRSTEPERPATDCSTDTDKTRGRAERPYVDMRARLMRWWGWLCLTTLGLLLLVSVRYFAVIDLDAQPASLMFRASMLLAHFTTFAAVALLPALVLVVAWPRPRIAIPL